MLVDTCRKQLTKVQEKVAEFTKDNDFIYHQLVPSEASLSAVQKMPAAKAISVSELYQGQDIQKIIGPDIFQRIVPMSVTESASLYDEEKAKVARAESERVETANDEMAASLDYLKLPNSLNVLKGGANHEMNIDQEFRDWCSQAARQESFGRSFEDLASEKTRIIELLEQCSKQLDMEESVCEKMRSKYGGDWTQQPSSRLTSTLRSDIKNYRSAIDEASMSDAQLQSTWRKHEGEIEELRTAGESDEADILYQQAMIVVGAGRSTDKNGFSSPGAGTETNLLDADFEDGSASVADQIAHVEELLRKLNLIKREREQVLKDLKDKVCKVQCLSPAHADRCFQGPQRRHFPGLDPEQEGHHNRGSSTFQIRARKVQAAPNPDNPGRSQTSVCDERTHKILWRSSPRQEGAIRAE